MTRFTKSDLPMTSSLDRQVQGEGYCALGWGV
jgi:hypothetical protein